MKQQLIITYCYNVASKTEWIVEDEYMGKRKKQENQVSYLIQKQRNCIELYKILAGKQIKGGLRTI